MNKLFYKIDNYGACADPCVYNMGNIRKIGSSACYDCEYNIEYNGQEKYIICRIHTNKLLKDKLNALLFRKLL